MQSQQACITDSAALLLARHPAVGSLDLAFEELTLRMSSNSEDLLTRLATYYEPFVRRDVQPHITVHALDAIPPDLNVQFSGVPRNEAGKATKEEWAKAQDGWIVRKVRTGMTYLLGPRLRLAVGDVLQDSNQIINFVDNQFLDHRVHAGGVLLHASGVATDCQGLAIAGFSGAGKSSLTLHFLARGFDFVSNDRVILDADLPGALMYGLAKQPRINPGTIISNPALTSMLPASRRAKYESMPSDELWNLEDKHDVYIDEHFGPGHRKLLARMCGLLILNWKRGAGRACVRRIRLFERPDLVQPLLKSPGVLCYNAIDSGMEEPQPEAYIDALERVPVYEVSGGVDYAHVVDYFSQRMEPRDANLTCI